MNSKAPDPRQFTKLFDELVISDAWRSAGINVRRFVDFLMHEHHSHGGNENGLLKAPYEQLAVFGVGARHIADAIRAAEDLGLVDCFRGGLRVVTLYALTWLPLHDGTPASDRWREYRNPKLRPHPAVRCENLPAKGKAELPAKGKADAAKPAKSTRKREGRSAKNLPAKGKVLSRKLYQGGAVVSVVEGKGEGVDAGQGLVTDLPDRPSSGKPNGHAAP